MRGEYARTEEGVLIGLELAVDDPTSREGLPREGDEGSRSYGGAETGTRGIRRGDGAAAEVGESRLESWSN